MHVTVCHKWDCAAFLYQQAELYIAKCVDISHLIKP